MRPTILVVEDRATERALLAEVLSQSGFNVIETARGLDALRQLEMKPDLVLLDVDLPDMNGFEVCRLIKTNPAMASLSVLHLSGVAITSTEKAAALEGGADGYLVKPVDPAELVAQVRALLRLRRAEEAARTSEERLRLIMNSAYDAFVAVDVRGAVTDWNHQAEVVFGWRRDEALGRSLAELIIPARHRPKHYEGLARIVQTGNSPFHNNLIEVTALHKDGHEFPAEVSVSAVRWRDEYLFNAFARDISPRKRAERAQALQQLVSEILIGAHGVSETLAKILQALCRFVGCQAGQVWRVDEPASLLRCLESWAEPAAALEEFVRLSRRQSLRAGEGLAGGVWKRGGAVLLAKLNLEDDPRLEAALRAGMRSAFACPLFLGDVVTGVLEFFGSSCLSPDVSAVLAAPSARIAQFLERKRVEEVEAEQARLAAFSADVATALAQSGTLDGMLQSCAEAMVRHLGAAFARIWILDEPLDQLVLRASAGLYTHKDGMHARVPVGQWKIGRIAQERQPHLTNDVLNDSRISNPDWARREGMVAFAGHPLVSAGKLIGVMALFARVPLSDFTLRALASAADNIAAGAHLLQAESWLLTAEEELRTAQRIQRNLYPRKAPSIAGFDIGGAAYPAEATGGDYFDFVSLGDGSLGVALGDVSGHGLGPALLMASVRASLRALALVHGDVSEILAFMNRILIEDTEDDQFVTFFLARLDPQRRSCLYSSAGHLTGYLLDANGQVKLRLDSTGLPLGIVSDTSFPAGAEVHLGDGDFLLLLTDGITCAPDGAPFGVERALAIARIFRRDSAIQIVKNLYGAVRAFSQDMPQHDDISAVVIKREAGPAI